MPGLTDLAIAVDALCVNVGWHEAQVPQIVTKVPRAVLRIFLR
jgi:2,4-dienoyl-CoA reductase (NADPH2)